MTESEKAIEIYKLLDDLSAALDEFRTIYDAYDGDFNVAVIGEDLYYTLQDEADWCMEGSYNLGERLSRGRLISTRVIMSPCPEFLKNILRVVEILRDTMEGEQ